MARSHADIWSAHSASADAIARDRSTGVDTIAAARPINAATIAAGVSPRQLRLHRLTQPEACSRPRRPPAPRRVTQRADLFHRLRPLKRGRPQPSLWCPRRTTSPRHVMCERRAPPVAGQCMQAAFASLSVAEREPGESGAIVGQLRDAPTQGRFFGLAFAQPFGPFQRDRHGLSYSPRNATPASLTPRHTMRALNERSLRPMVRSNWSEQPQRSRKRPWHRRSRNSALGSPSWTCVD